MRDEGHDGFLFWFCGVGDKKFLQIEMGSWLLAFSVFVAFAADDSRKIEMRSQLWAFFAFVAFVTIFFRKIEMGREYFQIDTICDTIYN